MNKLTIPAILVATVMVAGIFAFMPVQQASTVHTTATITLANDAITAAKIAANAIGADEIAANAITSAELADTAKPLNNVITTVSDDTSGGGAPTCTSDKDFVLYVTLDGGNADTVTIVSDAGAGTIADIFETADPTSTYVLGGAAGDIITITGSAATVDAIMTIVTQEGAIAECAP